MIWYLTVMLTYAGLDESQFTKWQAHIFKDDQECHKFVYDNKVLLVGYFFEGAFLTQLQIPFRCRFPFFRQSNFQT